jgi:hypothetical protein
LQSITLVRVFGQDGVINDATVADAILDRLVHNAYRLKL